MVLYMLSGEIKSIEISNWQWAQTNLQRIHSHLKMSSLIYFLSNLGNSVKFGTKAKQTKRQVNYQYDRWCTKVKLNGIKLSSHYTVYYKSSLSRAKTARSNDRVRCDLFPKIHRYYIDQHATETKREMSSDFYLYGMIMIYDTRYVVQQYVLGFQPQFPWDSI